MKRMQMKRKKRMQMKRKKRMQMKRKKRKIRHIKIKKIKRKIKIKKNKEENQEEAGEEHWYEIINQRLYDEYEFILDVLPHEFKKFYISRIDELLDQADG